VVRRLKGAGAVILGKLNMHEFAYGGSSIVSFFGPVRNPWSTEHIAGGSSSGSAVAVAAGLCYGALGSDTGFHSPAGSLLRRCGIETNLWAGEHARRDYAFLVLRSRRADDAQCGRRGNYAASPARI